MPVETKTEAICANVLVVEDDRRLLASMSRRLKAAGCRCITCDNAGEAMIQFTAGGIDLVITDLTMPGVDGLSVIGLIRSQSDVPIIVISGHAAEYAPLLSRYKNVTMIRKPFQLESFITRVQAALLQPGKEHAHSH